MSVPSSDSAAIRQIIRALINAGYKYDSVEHEEVVTVSNEKEAIYEITSVDESWFWVKDTDNDLHGVYFVLGNDPEEVAADWHVSLSPVIDSVTDKWV